MTAVVEVVVPKAKTLGLVAVARILNVFRVARVLLITTLFP